MRRLNLLSCGGSAMHATLRSLHSSAALLAKKKPNKQKRSSSPPAKASKSGRGSSSTSSASIASSQMKTAAVAATTPSESRVGDTLPLDASDQMMVDLMMMATSVPAATASSDTTARSHHHNHISSSSNASPSSAASGDPQNSSSSSNRGSGSSANANRRADDNNDDGYEALWPPSSSSSTTAASNHPYPVGAGKEVTQHQSKQQQQQQREVDVKGLAASAAAQLSQMRRDALASYRQLRKVTQETSQASNLYHETGLVSYVSQRFRSIAARNVSLVKEAKQELDGPLQALHQLLSQHQHHRNSNSSRGRRGGRIAGKANSNIHASGEMKLDRRSRQQITQHVGHVRRTCEELQGHFDEQRSQLETTYLPAIAGASDDPARIAILQVLAAGIGNRSYQRHVEKGFFDLVQHAEDVRARGEADEEDVSERQNRLMQQATAPYAERLALLAEAAGLPTSSNPPILTARHRNKSRHAFEQRDEDDGDGRAQANDDDEQRLAQWMSTGRKMSIAELRDRYTKQFLPHANVSYETPLARGAPPREVGEGEDSASSSPTVSLHVLLHGDSIIAVEINEALHKQMIFVHSAPFDWSLDAIEDVPIMDADQSGLCRKTVFHEQFGSTASRLLESLLDETPLHRSRATILAGHGTGGAVATAIAMMLFEKQFDIRNTVTFGAPKLLIESQYRETVVSGITPMRVVVAGDPLVELPTSAALGTLGDGGLFAHVGEVLVVEDTAPPTTTTSPIAGKTTSNSDGVETQSKSSSHKAPLRPSEPPVVQREEDRDNDGVPSSSSSPEAQGSAEGSEQLHESTTLYERFVARGPYVFSAFHYAEIMQRQDAPLMYVEQADEVWDEGHHAAARKKQSAQNPTVGAGEQWKKEREVPL